MRMTKKIIVTALSSGMFLGVVSSVAGTLAWYQYTTRVQTQMVGTSIGGNEYLQIAIGDTMPALESADWKQNLYSEDVAKYLFGEDGTVDKLELEGMTYSSAITKDSATLLDKNEFHYRPSDATFDNFAAETHAVTTDWKKPDFTVKKALLIQIPLWVRCLEERADAAWAARNVALSDITISNVSVEGKKDITDAVRVHVTTGTKGGLYANVASTDLSGKLNLNPSYDGVDQYAESLYEDLDAEGKFDPKGEDIVYGLADAVQTSYDLTDEDVKAAQMANNVKSADELHYVLDNASKALGRTTNSGALKLTVSIWLEGWQKLATGAENETDAIWSEEDYSGSKFHIGMTFVDGDIVE